MTAVLNRTQERLFFFLYLKIVEAIPAEEWLFTDLGLCLEEMMRPERCTSMRRLSGGTDILGSFSHPKWYGGTWRMPLLHRTAIRNRTFC